MEKLFADMIMYVFGSLIHNSIYLIFGIFVAVVMKVYIDPEKVKQWLLRQSKVSIPASVAFGAFTPLCACGTMAVIIAMLSTALPLGPIMAFLTSSPLMSPDGFILVAGIISFNFAIALTIASIVIGVGSGYATHIIEKKTDFLKDQIRFAKKQQACGCSGSVPVSGQVQAFVNLSTNYNSTQNCCAVEVCCVTSTGKTVKQTEYIPAISELDVINNLITKSSKLLKKIKWQEIANAVMNIGVKQILFYYSIFVAVGFLINHFVPASIIVALFSAQNIFAVPLAALIGLPIYVNGESAIPLIQSLMAGGASGGAMLAFLITGPGTSAGVIAGIATIIKRRALALYVLFLLVGGIVLGYLYDLFTALGI